MKAHAAEYATVNGLRLRFERRGEGPPLLLINGLGAPLEMWEPLVGHLGGYEVITFDMPGCGLSTAPPRPVGMGTLAAIVSTFMDRLRRPSAHVLGYSLGGQVAQELAYRDPGRVERLVLVATTAGFPSLPPDPLAGWLMVAPTRYRNPRAARMIVPVIAGGRSSRSRHALESQLPRRLAPPPTVTGYLNQLYATWGFSSHAWIRRISHRTLVIQGDDDPLTPLANARYLARVIPRAKLAVMRGAGHLLLVDEAERAGRVIRQFLADRTL